MSNVIYRDDENYPKLLKEIGKQAPKQLYYKVYGSSHSDIFNESGKALNYISL